jgi:hypothetical protein
LKAMGIIEAGFFQFFGGQGVIPWQTTTLTNHFLLFPPCLLGFPPIGLAGLFFSLSLDCYLQVLYSEFDVSSWCASYLASDPTRADCGSGAFLCFWLFWLFSLKFDLFPHKIIEIPHGEFRWFEGTKIPKLAITSCIRYKLKGLAK